jgi:flagellar biogenesis protein FliO
MILMISRANVRRAVLGGLGVALVTGWIDSIAVTDRRMAQAAEDLLPPRVASAAAAREPGVLPARPFPPRGAVVRRSAEHPKETGGWWLGTAGIALALAVLGGVSLATRRGWRWPQVHSAGTLHVIGRTSLSPRHAVHLLSVGGRVLIVGTGPQGAPALLGELTDPEDLPELVSQRPDDQDEDRSRSSRPPRSAPGAQPQSVVVNWRRPSGDGR